MTGRIMYIDPWTGVSGDMLLAALADAGADEGMAAETVVRQAVEGLGLDADVVEFERTVEKGVSCTRLIVHGEDHPPLRHLAHMETMVDGAGLSVVVRDRSLTALRRLAEVEASIHGCSVEQIHFHEVGAVDTLVDVVGTLALVEALGVKEVVVGPIPVGGGTVQIAHGRMGVPAPATARLLTGFPLVGGPEMGELTTPTGALLVGALGASPGYMPDMVVEAIGHGAGTMKLECGPNVLRVLIGHPTGRRGGDDTGRQSDHVVELQTNLDDVSPEVLGHVSGLLRREGALDVWATSAVGKKERPTVVLSALVPTVKEEALVDLIFRETGTLGVRRTATSRWIADRGSVTVQVGGEDVAVKWGKWGGRVTALAAEYEPAVAAAAVTGLPLWQVMQTAAEAARSRLDGRLLP